MILDHLENAHFYQGLGARFDQAFAFLKTVQPDAQDGRYELDGNRLFALVQSYQTAPALERTFESHRAYADIQFILSGEEIIYYNPISRLVADAAGYQPERDVILYSHADDRPLYLSAGNFTVFWPQDGHKPGCVWKQSESIRKVVIKIRLID